MSDEKVRRVTIYKDTKGRWRYTCQGNNWKTIDASEQSFRTLRHVKKRIANRWPQAQEILVEFKSYGGRV